MSDSDWEKLLECDYEPSNVVSGSSEHRNSNDRKSSRIVQYRSSEIIHHRLHGSSRTMRLFRWFLGLVLLATVLLLLSYLPLLPFRSSSRVTVLSGWYRNTSRRIPDYVHPDRSTTLIEPVHICTDDDHCKMLLLIVVGSSPTNFDQR